MDVSRAAAIPLLAAVYLVKGVGVALSTVVALSVRQAVTPDHLLGRMNGTYRFVSYSVIPNARSSSRRSARRTTRGSE